LLPVERMPVSFVGFNESLHGVVKCPVIFSTSPRWTAERLSLVPPDNRNAVEFFPADVLSGWLILDSDLFISRSTFNTVERKLCREEPDNRPTRFTDFLKLRGDAAPRARRWENLSAKRLLSTFSFFTFIEWGESGDWMGSLL